MAQLLKCILVMILSIHSFSYLTNAYPYRPFDSFRLALTWPPAFCTRFECSFTPVPRDFIIHGLWPDNDGGDKLSFCENVPYTPITDPVLLERVKNNWIGLKQEVDSQFLWWEYQWKSHGTCSLLFYYQMGYFDLAVEMREENDIYGFLANHGIVPSNQYLYAVADITTAIEERTGKFPHLYCERFPRNEDIQMLVEVTLCFDPDGVMIDCVPGRWPQRCTNTHIYYIPPFNI